MKVRDVIDKCQELLEVESTREDLLTCFNVIECELALDYLPLYDTYNCNSNIVNYSEFKYNPARIVMCNCEYKIYPTHIQSKEIIKEIVYAYIPNQKELRDECSYGEEFLNCLAFGIVCEYLTSQGFYEEAAMWNKKYKKEINFLML